MSLHNHPCCLSSQIQSLNPNLDHHIWKVIFVKSAKGQMENCGYSVIRVIVGYTENVQVCRMQ
ncbi:hypothetical protein DPMN_062813 [Dreissena polymorpha]|uniref:Uncharacterized protein n=1 Tax=Dreissena polymorpha TaxID=45954 RepID=A0A9D4HJN6_DREPO|nr:hypothetical protein DPMN_062813 [Dreissena polymorpha]